MRNKLVFLFCSIFVLCTVHAQDVQVSGSVTDSEGVPLLGATIVVKGANVGTTTDFDGNYALSIPSNADTLIFSYVGYLSQEVIIGAQTTINVQLTLDSTSLDEVVVIGYGTQQKKDLTGSLSSIKASDFEAQPLVRTEDALQGRAAGVQVNRTSGAPGGGLKIRIRGGNSINGSNDPLYVIDGFVGADITTINPGDIQSLDVLKDASATAIYGSRGANGVVIITTKQARVGKSQISFEVFTSFDQEPDKFNLLSGSEYMQTINDKNEALGIAPLFSAEEIAQVRNSGDGTNWQDELFRTALTTNYQLSFSGGNQSFKYYISGNYVDQEGIIINSDFERYSLRTNFDAKLTERLNFKLNLYGTRTIGLNTNQLGDLRTNGPVAGALSWAPNIPVFDPSTGDYSQPASFGPVSLNPIFAALERNREATANNLLGNLTLGYELAKGLRFSIGGGLNTIDEQLERFNRFEPGANPSTSTAEIVNSRTLFWQNTNILNYKGQFGDHGLDVSAIYEQQSRQTRISGSSNTDFITNALGAFGLALGQNPQVDASLIDESLESYLGRVSYNYKDKYLLTATFRADGSSKFQKDNRWGYFPSASVAWRVSNENFLKDSKTVSDLKLRASYGETGNQAIAPFQTLATLNFNSGNSGSNFPLDGENLFVGVGPGTPPSPDLTWETTAQKNFGLDLALFYGRLSLTADYYHKETTDLLLEVQLPDFTGAGSVLRNVGALENEGYEFLLSGLIVDTPDFSINSSFNISFNDSKVLDLGGEEELFLANNYQQNATLGPPFAIIPGNPLGLFRGLEFDGIWSTNEAAEAAVFGNVPGDPKYVDQNGDDTINGEDLTIIGNAQPDFIWGFNTDIAYKSFDLNLFFQGVAGNDIFNFGRYYRLGGTPVGDATSAEILNRWTPNNQNTDVAAFSPTSNVQLQSSQFIEDGSYIRLRNITLGYNLPEKFLNLIGMDAFRIYVSAQNLFTITDYSGYNPEVSSTPNTSDVEAGIDTGAYPFSKTYTAGVRLQF